MPFAQVVFKILVQLGYRTKLWKVLCPLYPNKEEISMWEKKA